jgi:hypothetical protein
MLVVLVAIALSRPLHVDEHQFVASGALLAREGLLPYRDYPYFHTPYLAFVYALLFQASDYLLLSARLFSVACAWGCLLLVVAAVWHSLSAVADRTRVLITSAAAVLLFANPLVRYSCWRAWNHQLSIVWATAAVLGVWLAFGRRNSGRWLFASGLMLAIAIGTRLSFAPLALPLFASAVLVRSEGTSRLQSASAFVAGSVVGAVPMLWIFLLDPRAFIFGNFTWNGPINDLYRGVEKHFDLGDKLLYVITEVLANPGNLVLLCLFVGLQFFAFRQPQFRGDARNLVVVASLPFVLIGALAPPIPYKQYFYALVPLLVLGTVRPAAALAINGKPQRFVQWAFALAALVSLISTIRDFRYLPNLASPSSWAPLRVHNAGLELAALAAPGPVLTLAPITALEGGLRIYPALATGPFAYKTVGFLSEEQRREFGFIGSRQVPDSLEPRPPSAICTSDQGISERALLRYKDELGYVPVRLSTGETAWVARSP